MSKILKLAASLTAVFLGSFLLAQAATTFYSNQVGTSPVNGYYLQTDGTNSTWAAVSSGSGTISTSSPLVAGQSVYATGVNTIASVATSTITAGTGVTFTGTPGYLIGGTNLTINASSGGSGLATTSPVSAGDVLVYSAAGAGSAFGAATSTLTATSPLTGSFTHVGSTGSLGIQVANTSQDGYLSSTDWNTFNGKLGSYDAFTHPSVGVSATTSQLNFAGFLSTASSTVNAALHSQAITPIADNTYALGAVGNAYSDLFLGSGGVINFNDDILVTHSVNDLTFSGSSGAGNGYFFDNDLNPVTSNGAALGDTTHQWSDLFLASGGVLNWANGDATLTHSTGKLTLSTGDNLTLSYASTTALTVAGTSYLGTVGSGVLTGATGLPLTTGVTGTLPIANGGTNYTSQSTNGVAYFDGTGITSGTGLVYSGGNVGVGVLSPTHTLDVAGNQTVSGYLNIGSNSTPTNTNSGDLTATRVIVGNPVVGSSFLAAGGTLTDTTGSASGAILAPQFTPSAANTGQLRGLTVNAVFNGTNNIALGFGSSYINDFRLGGSVTNAIVGFNGVGIQITGLSQNFGTVNQAIGASLQSISSFGNTFTGTISNAVGVQVVNPTITSQTVTNAIGAVIRDQTVGTNNTSILLGTTAPTGNYGIYQATANNNYFAGNFGIGSTTPGSLLSVGGNGTGTNFFNNATTTKNGVGGYNISGGCYAIGGTCIGAVSSVSNSDSTLTISPTTGAVVASLNLAHANTWSALQQFNGNASTTQLSVSDGVLYGNAFGLGIIETGFGYMLSMDDTGIFANNSLAFTQAGGTYSASNPLFAVGGYSGTGMYGTSGSANISFAISGSERARIASNGNFGIASTSPFYSLSVGTGNAAFAVSSTGEIIGYDATNAWDGRISPTHRFMLPYATTTLMTGTSSATEIAQMSSLDMDFVGVPRKVSCKSDGFVGIEVDKNGTALSPSYFVASSTQGVIHFTGSPTFAVGDTISIKTGTTTTDANFHYVRCTFDVTETP